MKKERTVILNNLPQDRLFIGVATPHISSDKLDRQ
jgi:hypothetical protein